MKFEAPLRIAADHPAYAGHFPNFPVCPGAVLLDEMLICLQAAHGLSPRDWRIAAAKFIDSLRPGDEPVLEYEAGSALIHFTIRIGTRNVVTGTLAKLVEGSAP